MGLIPVRNKETKAIHHVTEEWLERWPADFERVDPEGSPEGNPTPATGTDKKEKA